MIKHTIKKQRRHIGPIHIVRLVPILERATLAPVIRIDKEQLTDNPPLDVRRERRELARYVYSEHHHDGKFSYGPVSAPPLLNTNSKFTASKNRP